jgi:hypothetical protein
MIEIEDVSLEERNQYSAIKWGVITFFVFLIFKVILNHYNLSITNPKEVISVGLLTIVGLVSIAFIVLHLGLVIWIIKIAIRLNRSPFIWGFFGLLSSPITLIFLGFKDYYIDDKILRSIIDETRLDFKAELVHIKSTQDLTVKELANVESDLKESYQLMLNDKVRKYLASELEKIPTENYRERLDGKIVTEFVDDYNPDFIVDNDSGSDLNKCPACGSKINESDLICYECGLSLK